MSPHDPADPRSKQPVPPQRATPQASIVAGIVAGVIAIVAIFLSIIALKKSGSSSGQHSAVKRELAAQRGTQVQLAKTQAAILKQLAALREASTQQTAVLSRAVGNIIPVQMPAKFNQRLAQLEQSVAKQSRGQATPSEARAARQAFEKLARQLPPWAQQDYLARINPLRWSIISLCLLHPRASAQRIPSTSQARYMRAQLLSAPSGTPGGIRQSVVDRLCSQLTAKAKRLDQLARASRHKAALSNAKNAIENGKSIRLASAAMDGLTPWANSKSAQALTRKLAVIIWKQQAIRQCKALQRQLHRIDATKNTRLEQSGASLVYQSAMTQELLLVGHGTNSNKVKSLLASVRKKIVAIEATQAAAANAAHRRYQAWALAQILQFKKAYNHASNGGWSNARYKAVMHGMINDLLPISVNDLDPAVAQEYNREFEKGWTKLKGREDQTYVAKQTKWVHQRFPQDFIK